MIQLTVNKEQVTVEVDPDTPLLWVLRDHLNLTGTKYSCGIGQCGACTILANGKPLKSCLTPVSAAITYDIVTIEGLSKDASHPVQQAWIEHDVPQCGYCQSGQVLTAVALLDESSNPSDEDIERAMTNICRCGTYAEIKSAIKKVASSRGGA